MFSYWSWRLDIVRVNESQLVSEVEEDLENYDDEDDSNGAEK